MFDAYSVITIEDDFYAIDEGGVRCFLLLGDDRAVLVDTGFGKGDLPGLVRSITDKPVEVVQTHCDMDHTGKSGSFSRVTLHEAEAYRYRAAEGQEIVKVQEGDMIRVGRYAFRVIHIPGHTPGSIALLEEEKKFLIAGDSVQNGAIFLFGEGRDIDRFIGSIRKLSAMRDKFSVVYASHGALTVPPAILTDIEALAEKVRAGEIEGTEPPMPMPCKYYKYGCAGLLR